MEENKADDYILTHRGNWEFSLVLEDGVERTAGPNLVGMIKYTYYENSSEIPEVGWKINRLKMLEDYFPKVHKDIQDGKIKPGKHEF